MSTTLTYFFCASLAVWIAAVIARIRSSTGALIPRGQVREASLHAADAFRRLFSPQELQFVEESAGGSAELSRRLRQNRRQVFTLYLAELKLAHSGSIRQLRELSARLDRPDLAREALRRSLRFNFRYWLLRLQLAAGLPVTQRTTRWVAGIGRTAPAAAVQEVSGSPANLSQTALR